jgi:hypothetical protein
MQQRFRAGIARAVLVGVMVVGAASACRDDPLSPTLQDLAAAEAKWNASRPVGNSYEFTQFVSCFCVVGGGPFRVTVMNGVVTSAMHTTNNVPVAPEYLSVFKTVDQLFARIRETATSRGTITALEYDADRGYPRLLGLDPIPMAVDDEVTYQTSALTPNR